MCGGKRDSPACFSTSNGSLAVSYVSLYIHPVHTRRTVRPSLELSERNALSDVGDNWIKKWFQFSLFKSQSCWVFKVPIKSLAIGQSDTTVFILNLHVSVKSRPLSDQFHKIFKKDGKMQYVIHHLLDVVWDRIHCALDEVFLFFPPF